MSGNPVGRPPSKISVRVPPAMKLALEAQAKSEGMNLSQYLTKNYEQLVSEGKIMPEMAVDIPNPATQYGQQYAQQSPYGQQQSYGQHPISPYPYPPMFFPPPNSPYAMQPTAPVGGPDQMDVMFADMRKMFMTKMMAEMIQGKRNVEDTWLMMQNQGQKNNGGLGDMSFGDMMKWQMIQSQMERQQQQQMQNAQLQLEAARSKGDVHGENKALEMIVALSTSAAQQNQNFMTQFMTAMQMQQNTQQTLYSTALGTNKEAENRAAQERQAMNMQMTTMQNQMNQQALASMQTVSTMQVEHLKQELERMRLNPAKDPLTQLIEIDRLAKESPVMQAAMKSVGMGGGGGEGGWMAVLQKLGAGQFIERIIGMITGQAVPGAPAAGQMPMTPPAAPVVPNAMPGAMPMPNAMPGAMPPAPPQGMPPGVMPPAMEAPSTEDLANLHLIPQQGQDGQPQQVKVPAATKGYNNLDAHEGAVNITAKAPTTESSKGYNNLDDKYKKPMEPEVIPPSEEQPEA